MLIQKDRNSTSAKPSAKAINDVGSSLTETNGRRREISTGAFERDGAAAEKVYAAYLARKHTPNFRAGDPAQVMIADVLAFYASHQADQGKRNDNIALALMMLGKRTVNMTIDEITPVWGA